MTWDRDSLLMELNKFSFKSRFRIKGALAEYFEFYHSDLYRDYEELDQRIGWLETDDYRIVMQSFVPADALSTVFLFHGYFDHAGIYHHLIRFLVEHRFAVVIYDMPGHGLSSGEPTSISSFDQYQDALDACLSACEAHLPKPFHAVGQSTGGAVLIDRLMREAGQAQSFDKVVLLAPLVRPVAWGGVARLHTVVSPFLKVWHRSFSQNSTDVRFVKFLKERDPLQSKWLAVDWVGALKEWIPKMEKASGLQRKVAIVQGTDDMTVDWKHNILVLRSLFKEVKVVYIEGGRHHLVNECVTKRQQAFAAILSELNGASELHA